MLPAQLLSIVYYPLFMRRSTRGCGGFRSLKAGPPAHRAYPSVS